MGEHHGPCQTVGGVISQSPLCSALFCACIVTASFFRCVFSRELKVHKNLIERLPSSLVPSKSRPPACPLQIPPEEKGITWPTAPRAAPPRTASRSRSACWNARAATGTSPYRSSTSLRRGSAIGGRCAGVRVGYVAGVTWTSVEWRRFYLCSRSPRPLQTASLASPPPTAFESFGSVVC